MRVPTRRPVLAIVDLVVAAVIVALLVTLSVAAASVAIGYGLVAIKHGLFVGGILLTGIAVIQLRTALTPHDEDERDGSTREFRPDGTRSHLRPVLEAVLPESWHLAPEDRFSPISKLPVAGLLVLLVSFLMEVGLGV